MLRSHFGLEANPFDTTRKAVLLPHQQDVFETLNEDIKSRVTYSVKLPRLNPDDMKAFLYAQCDVVGLGHNAFSDEAVALIVRSSEGILRRTRNLCISARLEAVRDRKQVVGIEPATRTITGTARERNWPATPLTSSCASAAPPFMRPCNNSPSLP